MGSLNSDHDGKAKGKEREMNGLALSQGMLVTYRSGGLIKEKESRFGIQSSLSLFEWKDTIEDDDFQSGKEKKVSRTTVCSTDVYV